MENITVQEFAKQIGDSHVNVIPNKYCGEVKDIIVIVLSVMAKARLLQAKKK